MDDMHQSLQYAIAKHGLRSVKTFQSMNTGMLTTQCRAYTAAWDSDDWTIGWTNQQPGRDFGSSTLNVVESILAQGDANPLYKRNYPKYEVNRKRYRVSKWNRAVAQRDPTLPHFHLESKAVRVRFPYSNMKEVFHRSRRLRPRIYDSAGVREYFQYHPYYAEWFPSDSYKELYRVRPMADGVRTACGWHLGWTPKRQPQLHGVGYWKSYSFDGHNLVTEDESGTTPEQFTFFCNRKNMPWIGYPFPQLHGTGPAFPVNGWDQIISDAELFQLSLDDLKPSLDKYVSTLAVSMVEWKQTASLLQTALNRFSVAGKLASGAVSLAPMVKQIIRNWKSVSAKNIGKGVAAAVGGAGSATLEYTFGWNQLYQDSCAVLQLLQQQDDDLKKLLQGQGERRVHRYRRQYSQIQQVEEGGYLSDGFSFPVVSWTITTYSLKRARSVTRHYGYQLLYPDGTPVGQEVTPMVSALAALDRAGLSSLPLDTVWDVIPFSFVVDWFVRVGDVARRFSKRWLEPSIVMIDEMFSYREERTTRIETWIYSPTSFDEYQDAAPGKPRSHAEAAEAGRLIAHFATESTDKVYERYSTIKSRALSDYIPKIGSSLRSFQLGIGSALLAVFASGNIKKLFR